MSRQPKEAHQQSQAADASAPAAETLGRAVYFGVLVCFFLSGFAALLYQTAWLRQFSLAFGTSELAVAAVLAAYMAGLALGAGLAARFIARVRRPIMVYGLLEAGIAVSALLVPLLLAVAGGLYVSLLGGLEFLPDAQTLGQPLYYLLVAFVVLAIPTAFMGATLPLLTRYAVRDEFDIGTRIAALYATNTIGAVCGTLVAAYVLLPRLGLNATVWTGVAVNVLVFGLAVLLVRAIPALLPGAGIRSGRSGADDDPTGSTDGGAASSDDRRGDLPQSFVAACIRPLFLKTETLRTRLRRTFVGQRVWILPLMLFSGANAFFYEVLWTRLLSHVIGGSIYAFATMLAAFLGGIALGGGFGGSIARDRKRAAHAFVLTQAAIAVFSVGVYAWMQALVPATRGTQQFAIYAVLVMLPATVFIGATFPLAVRVLSNGVEDAGRSVARIYAWNTLGAIVGAVFAAFWLIPLLGFAGSIKLAVLVNLALAVFASVSLQSIRKQTTGVIAAAFVLAVLFYSPQRPQSVIANTAFAVPGTSGQELYFAVGRSSSVLLSQADGLFDLRTNGLPEAAILPLGAAPVGQVQQWLTALPLIARPDAKTMLLVGFGGGVALENAPASLDSIDVVELEPEVISANKQLSGRRLQDPLQDDRISIVLNDARNAMRLSTKRYDIVASQPSHPWTAGASHLFTREFVALAKDHLNEDGVFLQWMSAGFVDEALLRSLAATLADVFDNVRLYQPAPSVLMFLASDGSLDLESELAATGRPITSELLYYSYMGLNGVSDLVVALMLDETGIQSFAAGAPLSTDDRNRMATDSRSLSDGLSAEQFTELLAPFDPLTDRDGWVHRRLRLDIDPAYIATRLLENGQLGRAERFGAAVQEMAMRELISGFIQGYRGDEASAREAFLAALATESTNQTARYALIQPYLAALAQDRAPAEITALAGELRGVPATLVRAWGYASDQDWRRVAVLDPELARAEVTDLWYPDATQLRAQWRSRAVGETAFSLDAIRLIDRVLAIRPSLDLLVIRAAAADVVGDPDAFIESVRYASQIAGHELDEIEAGTYLLARAALDTKFRNLKAMRDQLVQYRDREQQVVSLIDQMGEQLARIQVLMRP
jgi:spermidine synthase